MVPLFAGLDAWGHGWVVLLAEGRCPMCLFKVATAKTFAEAMTVAVPASIVAVDIPIGLMDRGFRKCNLLAREVCGTLRAVRLASRM
ncbi:MAG: hypothetical protein COR54_02285 [Elusimicrobia bacterium CG22_combo_CG10-13_8_21_14_all_63_91]|nr:MAG: hypothetical protein COR54_02285 [Elusimicrobia bacterium CG22_combo_CG10-13_8_21_14_all_63_91]PJA14713.1 MAG: hypothetical protein COX66_11915 [Elusimicrobia bacterium CG_4_10_14_0_2_um_filter_63_34]